MSDLPASDLPTLSKVLQAMRRKCDLTDGDCTLARAALNWLTDDPATRGDFVHKGIPCDAYGILWSFIDKTQEYATPIGNLTLA